MKIIDPFLSYNSTRFGRRKKKVADEHFKSLIKKNVFKLDLDFVTWSKSSLSTLLKDMEDQDQKDKFQVNMGMYQDKEDDYRSRKDRTMLMHC